MKELDLTEQQYNQNFPINKYDNTIEFVSPDIISHKIKVYARSWNVLKVQGSFERN
jgi:hypothetical protein